MSLFLRSLSKRFPPTTWVGFLILALGQFTLLMGNQWVGTWLTPVMWTGYFLFVDGVLYSLEGRSWIHSRRREIPFLLLLSVAVWLLFEAYNFHLQNWVYRGVPTTPWVRDFAYFWSFATIMPGVFVTADLARFTLSRSSWLPLRCIDRFTPGPAWLWFLTGAAMVVIPLTLPRELARYTFGSVWIGFIFLLDPVNERLGAPSFRRDWATGRTERGASLLLGGLMCGFLWEAWNYQAFQVFGGHWVYIIPEGLRIFGLHFGKMPVLGLLGFPPFALELYAFYHLLRKLLDGDRVIGPFLS